MGVKGINKKSHDSLIEALSHLEKAQLLNGITPDSREIEIFKTELELLLTGYDAIFQKLVEHIAVYDKLAMQVKVSFINTRLRKLKSIVAKDAESFSVIRKCILLINSN